MEDSRKHVVKTFNNYTKEEQKEWKTKFLEMHRDTLLSLLTNTEIEQIYKQSFFEQKEDNLVRIVLQPIIMRLLSIIREYFWKDDNFLQDKVETCFCFGTKSLLMSRNLEALMLVLSSSELQMYPELFRESASVKQIEQLSDYIAEMDIHTLLKEHNERDNASVEAMEKNGIIMQYIMQELNKFGVITVSAVFKIVLKMDSPLMPQKYIELYKKIGEIENLEKKILLSQFIIGFILHKKQRELTEVVCCFLNLLIEKDKSRLHYKNIAVVFTPIFFIDDGSFAVESNFKEQLEKLCNYLEFLLKNCKRIFVDI